MIIIIIIAVSMLAAGLALAYYFRYRDEVKKNRKYGSIEEPEILAKQEFIEKIEQSQEEGLEEQDFEELKEEWTEEDEDYLEEQDFEELKEEWTEEDEDSIELNLQKQREIEHCALDKVKRRIKFYADFMETRVLYSPSCKVSAKTVLDLLLEIRRLLQDLESKSSSKEEAEFSFELSFHYDDLSKDLTWENLPFRATSRARFLIEKIDEFLDFQNLGNNPKKQFSALHCLLFLREIEKVLSVL